MSNNRLNEATANRNNGNRMFDSQVMNDTNERAKKKNNYKHLCK